MRMKALLAVPCAVLCLAVLTVARPLEEEQDNNCLQRNLLEILTGRKLASGTRDPNIDQGVLIYLANPPPPALYI